LQQLKGKKQNLKICLWFNFTKVFWKNRKELNFLQKGEADKTVIVGVQSHSAVVLFNLEIPIGVVSNFENCEVGEEPMW